MAEAMRSKLVVEVSRRAALAGCGCARYGPCVSRRAWGNRLVNRLGRRDTFVSAEHHSEGFLRGG